MGIIDDLNAAVEEYKKPQQQQQPSDIFETRNREQVGEFLRSMYKKGYRYVVRDKDSKWLFLFSHKPKKYMDTERWGYTDKDLGDRRSLMAYPVRNLDMTEINFSNRSAKLITDIVDIE